MRVAAVVGMAWVAFACAAGPVGAAGAESFTTPPPSLIESLERARREESRWLLTTPLGRRAVRAYRVDSLGVWVHSPARGLLVEPGLHEWRGIAAIGTAPGVRAVGGVLGGVVGTGFAMALTRDDELGRRLPAAAGGLLLGAGAGMLAGGGAKRGRPLYTAVRRGPEDVVREPGAIPAHLAARLESGMSLRVHTGGGLIDDHLVGVAAHTLALRRSGPLPWSQVVALERRRSLSGRGAVVGGAVGALWVSSIGAAVAGSSVFGGGSPADIAGGLALGMASGGMIGALAGALVGSLFHDHELLFVNAPPP